MKKKILVTRKLLIENEEKLKKLFDVKLNSKDELYTSDKIIELSKDCDGILSAITDQFNKDLIEKLSTSIKIIANFAVGFGNIDVNAAIKKKYCCNKHTRGTGRFYCRHFNTITFRSI